MATFGAYESIPGLVASGDLSSHQYKAVKMASTAGAVIVAAAATDKVVGVLQNDPTAGQPADVAFSGIAKALSSGSVTAGTFLAANTTGQLADTTSANDRIVGFSPEANSTAANIIRVVLSISNL